MPDPIVINANAWRVLDVDQNSIPYAVNSSYVAAGTKTLGYVPTVQPDGTLAYAPSSGATGGVTSVGTTISGFTVNSPTGDAVLAINGGLQNQFLSQ